MINVTSKRNTEWTIDNKVNGIEEKRGQRVEQTRKKKHKKRQKWEKQKPNAQVRPLPRWHTAELNLEQGREKVGL